MSWLSEIALMIDEARAVGVALTLGDFSRDGNALLIKGVPADQWFIDRLEDLE